MTREDIENNVGYWQEKANLEYIRKRKEHGVNDPYMITEIDEAFDAGFDKGYQYAVQHPQWIPVEERLPKENQRVRAWSLENNEEYLCDYHDSIFEDFYGSFTDGKITHWMPIVPPRKE